MLFLVSQKGWNKELTNIVVEFYYSLGKMSSILRGSMDILHNLIELSMTEILKVPKYETDE